jgi:hypothetical protein
LSFPIIDEKEGSSGNSNISNEIMSYGFMDQQKLIRNSKEHLVDTIIGILKTIIDLDSLLEIGRRELIILVNNLRNWEHGEGK